MPLLFSSWTSYFTAIAIALVTYYALIGYWYYGQDILAVIGSQDHSPQSDSFVASENDQPKAYLQEMGNNEPDKNTIIHSLQLFVSKYPALIDSAYKLSLDQFIINECETHCTVQLSEEEVSKIWQQA